MEIDIEIGTLTDCLVDSITGEKVETEYRLRTLPIRKSENKGWRFDWSKAGKNGYQIYELFLKDSHNVEGRVSLKIDGGVADVELVETAPHNYGHAGRYKGVGGHLFAIACQISMEQGCSGWVAFVAKSSLIEYYQKTLQATQLSGQRMFIDDKAAKRLLDKYMKGR